MQCLGILEGKEIFVGTTRSSHSFQNKYPCKGHRCHPGEGWSFVSGALFQELSLKMSGAGICARCLSQAPVPWQEIWESPAKEQGESREQGHAGICTGGKMGLK